MKNFLRRVFENYIQRLFLRKAIRKIKQIDEKLNPFEATEFAFNFYVGLNRYIGLNIKPMQVKEEILELLKFLKKRKIKRLLEIGTASGGTLFLFSRIADDEAKIISIDLPEGKFGGGYPKWKMLLYKSFERKKQRIYLIRDDSHKKKTFLKIKKILGNKKLDFLFIDGDHTYDGVKKDFKMYSKLVKRGGIIAFHDIVYGAEKYVGGVPIFWNKIKKKYRYVEIVKNYHQGFAGIGLIYYK